MRAPIPCPSATARPPLLGAPASCRVIAQAYVGPAEQRMRVLAPANDALTTANSAPEAKVGTLQAKVDGLSSDSAALRS